jgi:hypothetical protein
LFQSNQNSNPILFVRGGGVLVNVLDVASSYHSLDLCAHIEVKDPNQRALTIHTTEFQSEISVFEVSEWFYQSTFKINIDQYSFNNVSSDSSDSFNNIAVKEDDCTLQGILATHVFIMRCRTKRELKTVFLKPQIEYLLLLKFFYTAFTAPTVRSIIMPEDIVDRINETYDVLSAYGGK